MNKTALGSQELYQVLEKLSFLHASGTDDRENSSLAAAGEAVCDPSKLPVVRKPNVWGLIWSPQRKLVGILAYKAVWHWVILPLKETVPRRSCWVLNLQPHLLFKNESIWPNSKREEQPTWCELPAASCGEMWACVGGCSLVSVSQPASSGLFWRSNRQSPGFVSCRAVLLWLAASNLLCYYPSPQLRFLRQVKQQWWWRKKWQQCWKMPLRFTLVWWAWRSCRAFWGWKWQCCALLWHEMHSLPSGMTKVGTGLCSKPVACSIGLRR